jgi:hypothetical protein
MKRRPNILRAAQHAVEEFVLHLAADLEDYRHWEEHSMAGEPAVEREPTMGFTP